MYCKSVHSRQAILLGSVRLWLVVRLQDNPRLTNALRICPLQLGHVIRICQVVGHYLHQNNVRLAKVLLDLSIQSRPYCQDLLAHGRPILLTTIREQPTYCYCCILWAGSIAEISC